MVNYAYVAAFSGCIITFIAGTTLTWFSPEESKFKDIDKTPFSTIPNKEQLSWISSTLALGAALGPFLYGYLADKIGRKYTILSLAFPFLLSYLLLAFGKDVALFYVARGLSGLVVGGAFTVVPMYLGEVADDTNRGALGSFMNCFICSGLLFSYILGPYVSIMVFNIVLAAFPVLFIVLFFLLAPETPHYFVAKNQMVEAKIALKKLRGEYNNNIDTELEEIQANIAKAGKGSFMDLFKSKGLIKGFVISVSLVAFQQFSGINAVLSYAQKIFEAAGTSIPAEVCPMLTGGTQFITSFITPFVADRYGRKILLIISGIGMAISEIPLGIYFIMHDKDESSVESISFLPILCLILYIITYNVGFGPLPWAVMGELFPSNVKSIASSVTAAVCWFLAFLITKYFQSVNDAIGIGAIFLIFSGFCVAATVFSVFYVIETKGKNLQEIQDALEG